jgi:hypothetical protein
MPLWLWHELAAAATPAVSPTLNACGGSSWNLAAADCTAWLSLYDGTGGATQWTHCAANLGARLDPCGCSWFDSKYKLNRGVTCSADGQHILTL